jgi:hypothetical protein
MLAVASGSSAAPWRRNNDRATALARVTENYFLALQNAFVRHQFMG